MAVHFVAACAVLLWALGVWRGLLSGGRNHPGPVLRIRIPVSRSARESSVRPRISRSRPPLPSSPLLMVGVGAAVLAVIAVSRGWPTPIVIAWSFSAVQGLGTVVWRLLSTPPRPAPIGRS